MLTSSILSCETRILNYHIMRIKKMLCWAFKLLNSYIVMFVLVMSRRTIDSTRDGSLKITHMQ